MIKTKKTILEDLANMPIVLAAVIKGSTNRVEKYLADLILSSSDVRARSEREWQYKSLTELGEEDFITRSNFKVHLELDGQSGGRWHVAASKEYGYQVCNRLLFVDDEGLILFVKEGEFFRAARKGDTAYDFAKRLLTEGMVTELSLDKPATWADELFINAHNLAAYRAFWGSEGNMSDPLYARKKQIKTEAVWLETLKQMGYQPFKDWSVPNPETWATSGTDFQLAESKNSGSVDEIDPTDYPLELDAANVAFRAVSKGYGDTTTTQKNRLISYLQTHYPAFKPEQVTRIATVANPDKSPGRKKAV